MVTMDAVVRTSRYAASDQAQRVSFNPVGQVVGMMREVRSTRELIFDLEATRRERDQYKARLEQDDRL